MERTSADESTLWEKNEEEEEEEEEEEKEKNKRSLKLVNVSMFSWSTILYLKTSHLTYNGSQYAAGASVLLRELGWCWIWLKFNLSVTSPALDSVQPIILVQNLTSAIEFD